MGALEWPPGALAVFLKKREILMRITSMLRDNFPLGIITFRAAQRGLFEIAVILRFCWFKNIEKKLTCVHARLIPVLVAEPLIATSVRRAEPSWFAVWKGRSGSRQITTRSQEAFSDF